MLFEETVGNEADKKRSQKERKKQAMWVEAQRKELGEDDVGNEDVNLKKKLVKFDDDEDSDDVDKVVEKKVTEFDSENDMSDEEPVQGFINPLSIPKPVPQEKSKKRKQSAENFSSDDEMDDIKHKEKDKKPNKRQKKEKDEFEVVPQENFSDVESLDSDGIAETRAIAKLMLRKKTRGEILDNSFNRYAFHDDPGALPSWFKDDEGKHNKAALPVTKE